MYILLVDSSSLLPTDNDASLSLSARLAALRVNLTYAVIEDESAMVEGFTDVSPIILTRFNRLFD